MKINLAEMNSMKALNFTVADDTVRIYIEDGYLCISDYIDKRTQHYFEDNNKPAEEKDSRDMSISELDEFLSRPRVHKKRGRKPKISDRQLAVLSKFKDAYTLHALANTVGVTNPTLQRALATRASRGSSLHEIAVPDGSLEELLRWAAKEDRRN